MRFFKNMSGCNKGEGSSLSPSFFTIPSVQIPATKRRLQPQVGVSPQHPSSQGKVMRIGTVNCAKVLQMLGADKLEETVEILSLMNQAKLSFDSTSANSTLSEVDELDGRHTSDFPGSRHSSERNLRVGQGKARPSLAVQSRACPLSNSSCQAHVQNGGEQRYGLIIVPDNCSPQLSPRRFSFTTPQTSPQRDPYQTPLPLPLPTPPPSPSSSAIHKAAIGQQASPSPSPKAKIERSSYLNEKAVGRSRPSESLQQFRASTPLSSPPSPSLPQPSVHRSPLHSPPRTPLQSPSRTSLHSSPRSPVHSPWSLVHVPQCPRVWTKGQKLGQGSFGTVYEGLNQDDGSFFAVKISSQENASREIQQEVAVLSQLSHPNIVRYLGSSIEDDCLCIFLELVRMGSLNSILRKYKRLEENLICTYTRQILCGLEYLHQNNTIHRDIKCANILVDVNGQVKLTDFGVAKRVDLSLPSSCKGTPLYMAPEVMQPSSARGSYDFSADIWSLGCTILEMAEGRPPWSDLPGFGFYFKVCRGELPPIPDHLSLEARSFILECLRLNPGDRPTASELLQHPFVANAPSAIPPVPWLPSSPTGFSPLPLPWFHAATPSSPSAHINWFPSSPMSRTCYGQVVAGAQRAQTLLYG